MNAILFKLAFVLLVSSPLQEKQASILIQSIREFGGNYAGSPVYVFVSDTINSPGRSLRGNNITIIPLNLNDTQPPYPFLEKVLACAEAEELLKWKAENLVWIDDDALILNEPDEYRLDNNKKIAIRPVNLRNYVGLLANEPTNSYWQKIYDYTGIKAEDVPLVETLVENEKVKLYLNCATFSIRPEMGILNEWKDLFLKLISDKEYQDAACTTFNQKLFLHQAVLSAVISSRIKKNEIQWFTQKAAYPLHHHNQLAKDKQVMQLNDLESVIYEHLWDSPGGIQRVINVNAPLNYWLIEADTTGNYAEVKHAIEQSIGWAVEKDFEAMYRLWADNMFHFWLTSDSRIIGLDNFKKYSEVWKDPDFNGTRYAFRDLRIVFSRSGDVAWYSCFLDDCGSFNGNESCLKDVFQTGVLEKRDGRWVHTLMHGSYPIDKIPENYVRQFYSRMLEKNDEK
jgi:hypothetical protein